MGTIMKCDDEVPLPGNYGSTIKKTDQECKDKKIISTPLPHVMEIGSPTPFCMLRRLVSKDDLDTGETWGSFMSTVLDGCRTCGTIKAALIVSEGLIKRLEASDIPLGSLCIGSVILEYETAAMCESAIKALVTKRFGSFQDGFFSFRLIQAERIAEEEVSTLMPIIQQAKPDTESIYYELS